MREQLNAAVKTAMKEGNKPRLATIRLINAAIKDLDIEARSSGRVIDDSAILALMQKMIKSRQESLQIYEKAGRTELAEIESGEIAVIREFLPEPMSDADVSREIDAAIAETGASSIKDMGKVVGALKARFAGRMDFAAASAMVKARLAG